MDNEKLFELMTKMYNEMQEGFKKVNFRIDNVENEVKGVKDRVTIIEQDHGKKLDILLDGYKQNADKLDRIEKEVSRYEEIILRRIR